MMQQTAQIVEDYGRRYVVRLPENVRLSAVTRRKNTEYACGDNVLINQINKEQAVIESALPRRSVLFRQDAYRSKILATNISMVWIVLAAEPTPNETLLQRALLAAQAADVQAALLINKIDLPVDESANKKWDFYQKLAYPVFAVSATKHIGIDALRQAMYRHNNLLMGQSGMGKSTLINALLGEEVALTADISQTLDSGRHTTTHTRLYDIDEKSHLVDSPGLQTFGLNHLQAADLLHYMPDMRHLIGHCRFHNCTHRQEPSCAVKQAAESGEVAFFRLHFLQKIIDELLGVAR